VSNKTVGIRTSDGACDGYISYPDGNGPVPAALFYMDGIGIRPILCHMAKACLTALCSEPAGL
jgi:carboxymethylenebutenolidase